MSNTITKIAIGDAVEWDSQANGSWTRKMGRVVEIVPPGKTPHSKLTGNPGGPRDHESYVVEVRTGIRAKRLYWPRAAALRFIGCTPIASGRVCRDWGEWHARVPDDIFGEVFDLGGIDGESALMADLHPEVIAAYLSKPLPRGATS